MKRDGCRHVVYGKVIRCSGARVMNKVAVTLALTMAVAASAAWAGEGIVRLDTPKELAHLRATNRAHYEQALKILSAANHLCRPDNGALQKAQSPADAACGASLLYTSNPVKREIRFFLDHTQYAALVTVTDDPPRLMAASGY